MYPSRNRRYSTKAFDLGKEDAENGLRYSNPYSLALTPEWWRGYMIGFHSVYNFGA